MLIMYWKINVCPFDNILNMITAYLTFSGVKYVIKCYLFGFLERSRFHRVKMPGAINLCYTLVSEKRRAF